MTLFKHYMQTEGGLEGVCVCVYVYYYSVMTIMLNMAACRKNLTDNILCSCLPFMPNTVSAIFNNTVHHQGNERSIHWGLLLIDLVHHEE